VDGVRGREVTAIYLGGKGAKMQVFVVFEAMFLLFIGGCWYYVPN
jgi:hypothetical protein